MFGRKRRVGAKSTAGGSGYKSRKGMEKIGSIAATLFLPLWLLQA